jgi:subtilase family protein
MNWSSSCSRRGRPFTLPHTRPLAWPPPVHFSLVVKVAAMTRSSALRNSGDLIIKLGALALALLAVAASPMFATGALAAADPAVDNAVQNPRLDRTLAHMLERGAPDSAIVRQRSSGVPGMQDRVSLIVRGSWNADALAAAGATIETQAGPVATVVAPLDRVPALLNLPGVESVDAPRAMEPLLNKSIPEIGAPSMWGGVYPNVPPTGYTGKRVIVGIIDTGIDLSNADFRTTANLTRMKFLWDMGASRITPPPEFGYGCEYTAAQISSGLCPETDTDGHGTHMAGVAAADGRTTAGSYPAYRYTGVAPDADLIVVKLGYVVSEADVINGVKYVFARATTLAEDCVALVAWGNDQGAHDGSYNLDVALSALTGPGHIVVAAAGNEGGKPLHAQANVASGQTSTITFTIPSYTPSGAYNEMADVDFWHNPTAAFNVRLTGPSGSTSGWIAPGAPAANFYDTPDGSFQVSNNVTVNSKGGKKIGLWIYDRGNGYGPRSGSWRVEMQRVASATTGVVDGWVSGWRFQSGGVSPIFTSQVNNTELVQTPATGDSIISAGAYVSRVGWRDVLGDSTWFPDSPQLGHLASFSSPGPRRDGTQRPDIAAPGEAIAASLSSSAAVSGLYKPDDGVHMVSEGTSAAAAHVAGAVALLLQKTPHMSPNAVRLALISKARHDAFTGTGVTPGWGSGKLYLGTGSGSSGVLDRIPDGLAFYPAYPDPSRSAVTFDFVLSSRDLASQPPVRLRIVDVSGREVALLTGQSVTGRQRLTWNGVAESGQPVGPGVYMGRLEVGARSSARRFVRIQ